MAISGIKEFRARLQNAKQRILAALPQMAEELATSTLSMVKDRSINEGISVEGEKQNYSTNARYTSGYKKKTLNNAGKAYIAANKKGTWKGFRQAQGLRSEVVNLAYSNRMWTGIQVLSSTITAEGKAQTTIGSADQETRDKLEGNQARYGDFLAPTPEELAITQEVQKDYINRIILQG